MGLSLNAYATPAAIQACQYIDVQITTIELLGDGGGVTTLPVPENASDCIGAIKGNNSEFIKPTVNRGYDEDGWLNEEDYNGYWDGPGAFVNEADLLDLDGDGDVDDPGWIYVSESNNAGTMIGQTIPDSTQSYKFIDNLITFNNCKDQDGVDTACFADDGNAVSGEWVYTPPAQNPDELTRLLGGSFFDQVAVIFKAGNAFAMYNFSITALGLDPVLAGDYNFAFTGTWDISDVLADKGLSNVTFWARDPIGATEVSEPSTLGLLLLSSFFLLRRKALKR